jgi:hypothetical protein
MDKKDGVTSASITSPPSASNVASGAVAAEKTKAAISTSWTASDDCLLSELQKQLDAAQIQYCRDGRDIMDLERTVETMKCHRDEAVGSWQFTTPPSSTSEVIAGAIGAKSPSLTRYMSAFGERSIVMVGSKFYAILERPVPTASETCVPVAFMNDSGVRRNYDLIFLDPFPENGLALGGHPGFVTNLLPGADHTFIINLRIARPAGVVGSMTTSASFKKIYTLLRTWPSVVPSCAFCKLWSTVGKRCDRCGEHVDGTMLEINLAFPAGIDYGCSLFYTVT